MIFWLAVLVGALFAWIAVRIGFYATWIMFFHLLLAAYLAIFLAPVMITSIPAATALPGYGYALTVISITVATLFLAYGTCFVCVSGRLHVAFPRFLDTIVAGLMGFIAGFLVWSFLVLTFFLTPLAQLDFFKRIGFDARSLETNTSYIGWWCDRLHGLVAPLGDETTSAQAVALLLEKAAPQEDKDAKPDEPAVAPAPPPPSPAPDAKAVPAIEKSPSPSKEIAKPTPNERRAGEPKAVADVPQPTPSPPVEPRQQQKESLDAELARRRVVIRSPDALRAAVTNREVRIIELADACNADRFDAVQKTLLEDWVSKGGILWASNDILTLFGVHYSNMTPEEEQPFYSVSDAVDVAPIVANCKKVAIADSKGKANILASKGIMPLLVFQRGSPLDRNAATACWSLVPYGKGWVSDTKPVDTSRYDGARFWRNFCRFCLGKDLAETSPDEN